MRKVLLSLGIAYLLLSVTSAGKAKAAEVATRVAAPAVEIEAQPDVPLHLANFRFDPSPAGMTAFHYDVQNASGQGLVAVEVRWQSAAGGQSTVIVSNRNDGWLTGHLAAGDSERFQVSNVPDPSAHPFERMVGVIAYAEFEDGTRLGTDAAAIGKQVDAARRTALATYAELLRTFNAGGSEALIQALNERSAARSHDSTVQEATARLAGILESQNVDAVVLELERVASLSLPEAP